MPRPKIGRAIEVRFTPETRQTIEALASARKEKRAVFLRKLVEKAVVLYEAGMLPLD